MGRSFCSHDDVVVDALKHDLAFAQEYVWQAWEGIGEDGGVEVFLRALRHIIQARSSFAEVAAEIGVSSESLSGMLSESGDPTLSTVRQVVKTIGLTFARP